LPARLRNPFLRSHTGGRALSALHLPLFTLRPPSGFGVLTTTGRKTGRPRRKCVHVIRRGDRAYLVMLRLSPPLPPDVAARWVSSWMLNIQADPHVRLRVPGGTFAGVARAPAEAAEAQTAREIYCETVNLVDYAEYIFHRSDRPTRAKIRELHRTWFDTGIPVVIELAP
jgi:deazaflavin-dependent oxidoreductase (nitroreductase family)